MNNTQIGLVLYIDHIRSLKSKQTLTCLLSLAKTPKQREGSREKERGKTREKKENKNKLTDNFKFETTSQNQYRARVTQPNS